MGEAGPEQTECPQSAVDQPGPSVAADEDAVVDQGMYPLVDSEDNREVVTIESSGTEDEACQPLLDLRNVASSCVPENRIIIPVTIADELEMRALVDTGAVKSMVRLSVLRDHGISHEPVSDLTIKGFGEANVLPVIGTVTLSVSLHGHTMVPIQFYVMEDGLLAIPIVLAADFLQANKVTLDVRRKRLTFAREDHSTWEYYLGSDAGEVYVNYRDIPCYVESALYLLSSELMAIDITWRCPSLTLPGFQEDSYMCAIEPLSTGDAHVEVMHGLAELSSERSQVLIRNNGDTSASIKKGQLLCYLNRVIDMDVLCPSGEVHMVTPDLDQNTDSKRILSSDELGSHFSEEQAKKILDMVNERKQLFTDYDETIGCLGIRECRIELYDNTPIYQKPRRFPEIVNEEIERQCKELELLDIIEPSSSPWSSPVVPVRKKDGSIRLCVDYRRLNAITKPDKFPLPNLGDVVFGLHGMRFFTCLDFSRGFYQLPLDRESRELTAFSTPRAH